jgi:hypothetical protein
MSGDGIGCLRRLVHKDFLYLSLYRAFRAPACDRASALRRRMSLESVIWQSYLWWVMDAFARISAIFGKRPQFCPILVEAWRMNLEDRKKTFWELFDDTGGCC